MTEASWRGSTWPGANVLRCQSCGDQIGVFYGGKLPENVEPVCYACAAKHEAEAIAREALGGGDD